MLRDAPVFVHRKVTRGLVNVADRISRRSGDDFVSDDWDVLVFLDACRADYYRRQTPFDGVLETRWSPGSATHEFVQEVFEGRQLHETVYVTPNPHIYMLSWDTFHSVYDCRNSWDEELQTVPPETMTAICRDVAEKHPNKRLVFHYMQPHTPYLGDTADRIREEFAIAGWKPDHVSDGVPEQRERPLIWDLAVDGKIGWDDVRSAYAETLDIALRSVQNLLSDLDGRVVVSADHGELLGERIVPFGPLEWAHPEGLAAESLRRVPWHVVQDENRPEIVAEPPTDRSREEPNEREIKDRLTALGYVPDDGA